MAFEIKGKIKVLFERQDFPSGFYKRDFVITTNEQYPQDIKMAALKEKVDQLNGMTEGDEIQVKFDLRGREYNGNYYVDLNAWRIERGGAASTSGAASGSSSAQSAPPIDSAPLPDVEPMVVAPASDDDLPF
jgi:single-strand DNA-binding protein